ncbi:MAG: hypothetical protein PVF40_02845 [Ectothiorhodospiraceae bacterium]|jgi:methylglyoxal synthase
MNSRAESSAPGDGPVLVLLASRELRRGPDGPLATLLRNFEAYLTGLLKPRIFVLEGTYRALRRFGLLRGYTGLLPVASGRQGGLVTLGNLVVEGTADGRPVDAVVYLTDPRDATSMFPDSQALKRECVVTRTPFLASYPAAAEWFRLRWACDELDRGKGAAEREWFLDAAEQGVALGWNPEAPESTAIAMIAHDTLKQQMLDFAERHRRFLARFRTRYATGTTGALLAGRIPGRLADRWREQSEERELFQTLGRLPARLQREHDAEHALRAAAARLAAHDEAADWVDCQPSGPRGGDIRIAEAVRRGQCQRLIFFEDPHVSREHEADIQLLERATRIPGRAACCLHDPDTADDWACSWERCLDSEFGTPTLVADAFRHRWGVELLAVPSGGEVWPRIIDTAAWYLRGLLRHRIDRARESGRRVRAAVGWGRNVAEVLARLPAVVEELERAERGEPELSWPLLSQELPADVPLTVVPTVGILGLTRPALEANHCAVELAGHLRGRAEPVSVYGFPERAQSEPRGAVDPSFWDSLDVALVGCSSGVAPLGLPEPLRLQWQDSVVGEVGGIPLTADAGVAESRRYRRVGPTAPQFLGTGGRGHSILVAGRDAAEAAVVRSALKGGLVSALVTSLDFARRLLMEASDGGVAPDADGTNARAV